MADKSRKTKKQSGKQSSKKSKQAATFFLARPFVNTYKKLRTKRQKSVHKTFVLTRWRDRPAVPTVKGFLSFTGYVFKTVWSNKWLLAKLLLLYVVVATVWIGVLQNDNMAAVNEATTTAQEAAGSTGDALIRSVTVTATTLLGSLNMNMTEAQQMYMVVLYLLMILVTVWLLRQRLAGNKVRLRDGLYNSPTPMIPLGVLAVVGILQALPFVLLMFVYSTAQSLGVVAGGVEKALFDIAMFITAVLTLYFMSTTIFALMVATLPGTYPWQAYKTAKSVVVGQRMRLLFRLSFLAAIIAIVWFVVLVPVVMLASAYNIENSLLIPIFVQLLTGFSLIFGSSYCYLLYRKMIDDPVVKR